MAKKLPEEIFYIAPNGLLAYEDTSPNDYFGETQIIFTPYSLKGLNLQDKKELEAKFKTLKTRKDWEEVLAKLEEKVTLKVTLGHAEVVSITWTKNPLDKDVMNIKTAEAKYSYIAELAYQIIAISSIKKQ